MRNVITRKLIIIACGLFGASNAWGDEILELMVKANDGDANACVLLGDKYREGDSTIQDYQSAKKWYEEAAEKGHADGQYSLAAMFAEGLGSEKNLLNAHMWANLAAARGHERAAIARGLIEKELSPSEVVKAQGLARACLSQGYANCGLQ